MLIVLAILAAAVATGAYLALCRRRREPCISRMPVLGEPEEHVAKLQELAAAGVEQFNFYLMNGDEEEQLERYGREIIPRLAGVAPG